MINEDKGLRTYRTYRRTVLSAIPVRTNYSRSDKIFHLLFLLVKLFPFLQWLAMKCT